jgi:hypothetical protein
VSLRAFPSRTTKSLKNHLKLSAQLTGRERLMMDANGKQVLELIKKPGNSICADCGSPGKFLPQG